MTIRAPDREAVDTIRIIEPTVIGRVLVTATANESPEGTFKITVSYPAEGVDPHEGIVDEAVAEDILTVRKFRRWYYRHDEIVANAVTQLKDARFRFRRANLSPEYQEGTDHE